MIIQAFCTVDEIYEDAESRGVLSEAKVFEKIMAASQFLAMRAGRFLPVIETRTLGAPRLSARIFLPFPMTRVTSIVNSGVTLSNGDYLLLPDGKHWDNGPYTMVEVDPDASNLSAWDMDPDGIEITGWVAKYDATESLSATLGSAIATTSATSMRVSDGSAVSPGMLVLIGSEWIFVKATGTPVSAVTTLSAALDAKDEIITVADGSLLHVGEIIRMGVEQARILDINTNTVALQRGWNKTAKTTHADASAVDVYRNFTIERGVNGSTAATHVDASAMSRQLVPDDVKGLCRKIAMRMLKDASSGYSGRVGDDATGQSIYTYILPHELDEILDAYRIANIG